MCYTTGTDNGGCACPAKSRLYTTVASPSPLNQKISTMGKCNTPMVYWTTLSRVFSLLKITIHLLHLMYLIYRNGVMSNGQCVNMGRAHYHNWCSVHFIGPNTDHVWMHLNCFTVTLPCVAGPDTNVDKLKAASSARPNHQTRKVSVQVNWCSIKSMPRQMCKLYQGRHPNKWYP